MVRPTRREVLGRLIRNARIERGLGVGELAVRLGVSRYTVMNLERGHKAVGSDTLIDVLLELGLLSELAEAAFEETEPD
ncbi:helix-turn-helix domain-containing protein [Aquimonas sp.]|jgi:transcriptional regulator with XRE-family HTH domain|uniref:helix-turn-helix domain-containing protein n=1 Tax=Aquimonas sp. TaxID=1872588 RepID=UPI0037BFF64F